MNETIFQDGRLVAEIIDNGDGTGTRTTYDADGNETGVEQLTGLPIPPKPEPDPIADLQAQVEAQQAQLATQQQALINELLDAKERLSEQDRKD